MGRALDHRDAQSERMRCGGYFQSDEASTDDSHGVGIAQRLLEPVRFVERAEIVRMRCIKRFELPRIRSGGYDDMGGSEPPAV